MWSESLIKQVVNSGTPLPEEKVSHSFKAWKYNITTMAMLYCYASPSDHKERKKYPALFKMLYLTADSLHHFDWFQEGRKQQLADW